LYGTVTYASVNLEKIKSDFCLYTKLYKYQQFALEFECGVKFNKLIKH